jgi:hypothetical protein
VVATEGVDHRSHGRRLAPAGKVKVQHALDGAGLEAIDEGAGLGVERAVPRALGGRKVVEGDDALVGEAALFLARGGRLLLRRRGVGARGRRCRVEGADGVDGGGGFEAVGRSLADAEGERDAGGDVVLRAEDLDLDAEGLAEEAHGLEALLVVGPAAADKDADFVELQALLVLLERADDALEGGGDVGEVGDAAADDEDLAALLDLAAGHQIHCEPTRMHQRRAEA